MLGLFVSAAGKPFKSPLKYTLQIPFASGRKLEHGLGAERNNLFSNRKKYTKEIKCIYLFSIPYYLQIRFNQ